MAGPKYVRLSDSLSRGMRADLNSGFSIAGLDVVPMPDAEEEPAAYKFVKGEISAGRMEGASLAEYEEVHPDLYALNGAQVEKQPVVISAGPPVQEQHIQAAAAKSNRALRAAREGDSPDVVEADERRRKAAIKAQKAQEKATTSRGRRKSAEAEQEAADANDELEGLEDGEDGAPNPDDPTSTVRNQ